MTSIQTVRGTVQPAALGMTLMHEHLFVLHPEPEDHTPHPEWDEERLIATARAGLTDLAAKGVCTLVDLTVMGLGRFIPRIQRVAEGLPIAIVVATGSYTSKELPAFFRTHGPGRTIDGPDPLEVMFRRDITDGIGDTGVRAGVIKVATDEFGITPDVERVLRAAARVHADTGVLISTHTSAVHRSGREQQAYFRSHGVDLSRMVIGHCGDTTDLDYLRELMDNGSTIGCDRFGTGAMVSDEDRMATVVTLCEQGYADRITLSHDASFFSVTFPPSYRAVHMPDWHQHRISDVVLPELRRRGVTEDRITQMTVRNPARLLAPYQGRG